MHSKDIWLKDLIGQPRGLPTLEGARLGIDAAAIPLGYVPAI